MPGNPTSTSVSLHAPEEPHCGAESGEAPESCGLSESKSDLAGGEARESEGGADPIRIDQLFRDHNAALLRFVAAKLGSEQEAKEVAQEAYVRLLRLDQPEAIGYLRAFLFKTAANLALDRLRARGRRPPTRSMTEGEFGVFDLSPERQVSGAQSVAILRQAIAELPQKCRQAFLMHRLDGLNCQEIAARMGLTERMIRLYVARAVEHLRTRLDEADGNGGAGK